MKKYKVTFYYHSNVSVEVEAETEGEAIDLAKDEICSPIYERQILDGIEEDDNQDVEEVAD